MWQFNIISLYLVFANSSYAITTAYDDYIKKVCDSVKLVATSVNEATSNIYVACKNDMLTAYGYHWKFVE